ncbi:MAG: hypothetical protein ACYTKD_25415, partial [Planctomycetota bacterium]
MRGRAAALCFVLVPAVAWGGSAGTGRGDPGAGSEVDGPELTRDQVKQLRTLLGGFREAEGRDGRKALFEEITALGPRAAQFVRPVVDLRLAEAEKGYAKVLEPRIREAYLKRLGELTDEQIGHIQNTRRFWRDYLLNGGGREDFRNVYLIWIPATNLECSAARFRIGPPPPAAEPKARAAGSVSEVAGPGAALSSSRSVAT